MKNEEQETENKKLKKIENLKRKRKKENINTKRKNKEN